MTKPATEERVARQPKMNVKLLRRIQKHILAEPRRFDMNCILVDFNNAETDHFIPWSDMTSKPQLRPPCGTVGCIAGWAYFLSRKQPRTDLEGPVMWRLASEALGLEDRPTQERLFAEPRKAKLYGDSWPAKFNAKYMAATTNLQRAKVAVARIDHFIKTNGAE